MQINVGSLIYAILSIILAKVIVTYLVPVLKDTFDLTQKQENWIFLLTVWAMGYWGYALKLWIVREMKKNWIVREMKKNEGKENVSNVTE